MTATTGSTMVTLTMAEIAQMLPSIALLAAIGGQG